jgi:hypothetical protein
MRGRGRAGDAVLASLWCIAAAGSCVAQGDPHASLAEPGHETCTSLSDWPVQWLLVDLLAWQPARTYRVWHDRAVFHFLTSGASRRRYLHALDVATAQDSVAVFATFAPDGPQHCSGLPVARYSATELADLIGAQWLPAASDCEEHATPSGTVQSFTWAAFRRQG